jgi:hypothetical protein
MTLIRKDRDNNEKLHTTVPRSMAIKEVEKGRGTVNDEGQMAFPGCPAIIVLERVANRQRRWRRAVLPAHVIHELVITDEQPVRFTIHLQLKNHGTLFFAIGKIGDLIFVHSLAGKFVSRIHERCPISSTRRRSSPCGSHRRS